MKIPYSWSFFLMAAIPAVVFAQTQFTYEIPFGNERIATRAVYGPSKQQSGELHKFPAVVLIHSAGGARDGTTAPLASALNSAGLSTLELQLFERPGERQAADRDMARVFGALAHLASRPDIDSSRIGIAGFSMGAHYTLWAASQWIAETYGHGSRFAAHAAIYPVCWMHTSMTKGSPPPGYAAALPFPKDFLTSFTRVPVKLFAAGKDDYDDRDSGACMEFIEAIAPAYRPDFELITYADATHGWNQRSQSFFEKAACKGRGCMNRNVNNPEVTEKSTIEIVKFFREKLH